MAWRAWLCGLLFGSLWQAWAAEDIRYYHVWLGSPITEARPGAYAYLSLQQGIGRLDQWLAPSLPDHGAVRFSEVLTVAWMNIVLGHYYHELGHDLEAQEPCYSIDRDIDWSRWYAWPRYERYTVYKKGCGDPWQGTHQGVESYGTLQRPLYWAWSQVEGLDQEEYGAYLLARETHEALSWDEALAFVFRKVSDLAYEAYSGSLGQRGRPFNDANAYLDNLKFWGIRDSKNLYYTQLLLGDFVNWRLWESVYLGARKLGGGAGTLEPWRLDLGPARVDPPLVSTYLTPLGGFWDVNIFWKQGKSRGLLNGGYDTDWIAHTRLHSWRLGAEAYRLLPWWPLEIGGFGYMGRSTSLRLGDAGWKIPDSYSLYYAEGNRATLYWRQADFFRRYGYWTGGDIAWRGWSHVQPELGMEWSRDDLLHNAMRLEPGGWRARLSVKGMF